MAAKSSGSSLVYQVTLRLSDAQYRLLTAEEWAEVLIVSAVRLVKVPA